MHSVSKKEMRLPINAMLYKSLLLSLVSPCSGAQAKYVVLPAHVVNGIVVHSGTWEPTEDNIADLEAATPQIAVLPIEGWPSKLHIEHPEGYFRQYVPILRGDRKLIYVSAFCDDPPPRYWRSKLVVAIDGATCYWQAFYDPFTKKYSNLRINARA